MFGKLLTWIVLAIFCSLIIKLMLLLDVNKKVYSHVPGPCQVVPGIVDGSEDIELLPDGTALISSGLNYANSPELVDVKGKIFFFDFNKKGKPVAQELLIEGANFDHDTFNPHGMSSFVSKGRVTLYVVNHGPMGDSIECFTFNKQKKLLTHTKSITSDYIYSANDLVTVGADKFFVTNDHYFKSPWLRSVEQLMMMNLGNVVYYDGKAKFVDNWMLTPNGVALSKDKKHLYVAMPLQEIIRIYNVSRDNSLIKQADMTLLTSPDNIFVDPDTGDLWTGSHPIAHQILKHLSYPKTSPTPSQVLHIRIQGAHDRWVVTEPYANDGSVLWGSTSAVYHKEQLLIGTLSHKLLHCSVINPELI